jgi:ComF family protein
MNKYTIVSGATMQKLFFAFSFLFDALIPPRQTERAVRGLDIVALRELALPDGTLPYHEPLVTALVWELKYRRNPRALALAAEFLEEKLMQYAEDSLGKAILIPVPMHAARRRERGYNQTESLCEAILARSGGTYLYLPHVLERTRNTLPQQGLQRIKNIIGAMRPTDEKLIRGATCIVVDDVQTTGATVKEARRALLEAGAYEVHVVTLAHS